MATKKVPGAGYPSPAPSERAPLYEALGPVFVNGRLHVQGEQFRSGEKPGRAWRLIEAAKAAKAGGAKAAKEEKDPPAADPGAGGGDEPGREADKSPI